MPRPECHRRFADAFEQAGLPADLASLAADFVVGKEARAELLQGPLELFGIRLVPIHPCGAGCCDCLPERLDAIHLGRRGPAHVQRHFDGVMANVPRLKSWLRFQIDESRMYALAYSFLWEANTPEDIAKRFMALVAPWVQ